MKIYDSKNYFAPLFRYPCIIIEDDGYIYKEEDLLKPFPQPIGKIEWETGKIFGGDYYKMFREPIGLIKQCGNVTMIYGKEYYHFLEQPIGYIKDRKYYTAEDYFRLFGTPTFYIEE